MCDLNIIITGAEVLVSKKSYLSWRDIQDEYDDYKASLGPWDAKTVSSWLNEEYGNLAPSAEEQVDGLLSGHDLVRAVSFASQR